MNIRFRYLQEGGPMPAPEAGAPQGGAPEQGGDPVMELAQMAQQALETQDPQLALQVCEGLLQLLQGGQGGAPEGAEAGAPAEPAPEEVGQPVYRAGGRLIRRVRM